MYLIFGSEQYYATGGAFDLLSHNDDFEEACKFAEEQIGRYVVTEIADWSDDRLDDQGHYIEWTHVFDCTKKEIVKEFGTGSFCGSRKLITIRDSAQ